MKINSLGITRRVKTVLSNRFRFYSAKRYEIVKVKQNLFISGRRKDPVISRNYASYESRRKKIGLGGFPTRCDTTRPVQS